MKILVTGGCGLIGYHAAKYYAQRGHEVTVMDNFERSDLLGHEISANQRYFNHAELQKYGVKNHSYDVSIRHSWSALRGHDYVLHFAGQCGVPTSLSDPRRDFEINTVGTLNALEYCREHGAALAFASTNKVYAFPDNSWVKGVDGEWQFCDTELTNGCPTKQVEPIVDGRTPYGASKFAADTLCQEYAHSFGVRTGVFRMSCIYGPNQFGFAEQGWATWFIIAAMKKELITIYGDGYQLRDMLYVEDCVKAYDAFLSSDIDHGVWNLGGGSENTLTLLKHLDFLQQDLGLSPEVTFEGWRPHDHKNYVSDIIKVTKDLNWRPLVTPEEGLRSTAQWVQDNLDVF